MNFNPLNHFDLMGVLMFMFIGFGYAKPVPIDPRNFHNYKKGYYQVAVAGVLTNLVIAFFAYPLFVLAKNYVPDFLLFDDFLRYILQYLVLVNIWLMVFNLLPIYPLDGFRLVELYSRPHNKYVSFMYRNSQWVILGILALSIFGLNVVGVFSNYIINGIEWIWSFVFI